MIISVGEVKKYLTTDKTNDELEMMLQAIELSIRAFTNNNFQNRTCRRSAAIESGVFLVAAPVPFRSGDTIQVTESGLNEGLFTVADATETTFTVNEEVFDEKDVLVTKVLYPTDIKMGVVNMIKWELENRDKAGIASETISRHSVTYIDLGSDYYPKSLLGFLKPYKKAKF